MKNLLWVGDYACDSGFAKCTHNTLPALDYRGRGKWNVSVLGLNYRGYPTPGLPYDSYPAFVPGGDLFGVSSIRDIVERTRPELIVIQNDPWNFPAYMKALSIYNIPVVGAVAVDGQNCAGRALNRLTRAVFWTRFGQQEALRGGMTIPSGIAPLGVDLNVYRPGDRAAARLALGLPDDVRAGFIVGNMNRNQPRKRLDLTIRYFANWVRDYGIEDAYLYLHVAPTGEMGYHCDNLGEFYGVNTKSNQRLIMAVPGVFHGASEEFVVKTLQAFDVQVSTALGEGWGLTTMEGMACGIPQIVPEHSAHAEWARGGVQLVPCDSTEANPMSVIGSVASEKRFIEFLNRMYRNHAWRRSVAESGVAVVNRPEFRWDAIADRFSEEVDKAYADWCKTQRGSADDPAPAPVEGAVS